MHLCSRSAKVLAALAISMATTLPVAATLPKGYKLDPNRSLAAFHDHGFSVRINGVTWALTLEPNASSMAFSDADKKFTMTIPSDGPITCTLKKETGEINYRLEEARPTPEMIAFVTAVRQDGPVMRALNSGTLSQRLQAELALIYCMKTQATGGIPDAEFLRKFIQSYRASATSAPAGAAAALPVAVPAAPAAVPPPPASAREESKTR